MQPVKTWHYIDGQCYLVKTQPSAAGWRCQVSPVGMEANKRKRLMQRIEQVYLTMPAAQRRVRFVLPPD